LTLTFNLGEIWPWPTYTQ